MTSAAPQALAVSRHTNPIGPGRGERGREGREERGEIRERERGERGKGGGGRGGRERRGGRRWEVKEGEVKMEGCKDGGM